MYEGMQFTEKTTMVINNNNKTGARTQRVYEMDGDGKIGHLDFKSLNYR